METSEWIRRCALRLREQWRHVPDETLRETAAELQADPRWSRFGPEVAAVAWLRLGVLTE